MKKNNIYITGPIINDQKKELSANFMRLLFASVNNTKLAQRNSQSLDELAVSFFGLLTGSLEDQIHELNRRLFTRDGEPTKYYRVIDAIKNTLERVNSDDDFLAKITKTAVLFAQNARILNTMGMSGSKVEADAETARAEIISEILHTVYAIEKKVIKDPKVISSILEKFKAYDSNILEFDRFIYNYFFGGARSPFFNGLIRLLKNETFNRTSLFSELHAEMDDEKDDLDFGEARALNVSKGMEITVNDLQTFLTKWRLMSRNEKNNMFLQVIKELRALDMKKEGINPETAPPFNPESYLIMLPELARSFDTFAANLKNIERINDPNRKRGELNALLKKAGENALFEKLYSEVTNYKTPETDTIIAPVNELNSEEQIASGYPYHREMIHGIAEKGLPVYRGRSTSILNISFQRGLAWAKNLIGDIPATKAAEQRLEATITNEIKRLIAEEDFEGVENLYYFLALNAVLHTAAEYYPSAQITGGGKKSKAQSFDFIFSNYLKAEYDYYQIPPELIAEFDDMTAEWISSESFREIKTRADMYRRELALTYSAHNLGYDFGETLSDQEVNELANDIYQRLYATGANNFTIINDSQNQARGIVIPNADRHDMIDVITKEIRNKNKEIARALAANPNMDIENVPLNWKAIFGKLSEHQEKIPLANKNIKKAESENEMKIPYMEAINELRLANNNISEEDIIYLKWCVSQGIL